MRFQDGLFTGSTSQNQVQTARQDYSQPQTYTPPQAYPGDTAKAANVDTTYTGSISRQAVQPVGVASAGLRRSNVPVPSANVGPAAPLRQPLPQMAAASRQPFPAPAASGGVTRLPAPAVASAAPAGVDRTVTGAIAPRPQKPASVSKPLPAPTEKTPLPGKSHVQHVAVLPQDQKLGQKQPGHQASSADPAKTTPNAGSVYTVQSGDTLSAIARRMGTTPSQIKQVNGLDTALIRVGQKLVVPGAVPAAQVVASAKVPQGVDPIVTGSTGADAKKAETEGYTPPRKDEKVIEKAVEQAAVAPDATGIGRMRWPVRGRVVSAFGALSGDRKNDGIDIAVPEGTPIKAAENGVVIYAGDGLKDFGKTVLVRHEGGLVTVYGHASEIEVERGDNVRRGQEIARSGLSGNADSPKLHFEVRKNSSPVDPVKFLE